MLLKPEALDLFDGLAYPQMVAAAPGYACVLIQNFAHLVIGDRIIDIS